MDELDFEWLYLLASAPDSDNMMQPLQLIADFVPDGIANGGQSRQLRKAEKKYNGLLLYGKKRCAKKV